MIELTYIHASLEFGQEFDLLLSIHEQGFHPVTFPAYYLTNFQQLLVVGYYVEETA
ncbi:MAG: hypothetical protein KAJ55_04660 [Anaerolineales bacterium]|nr:hypothetical protein [Anaerolineales bacterium]